MDKNCPRQPRVSSGTIDHAHFWASGLLDKHQLNRREIVTQEADEECLSTRMWLPHRNPQTEGGPGSPGCGFWWTVFRGTKLAIRGS